MKLVFATHNQNKLIEVRDLMPGSIQLLSLTDIGCHEDIPETAPTIEGNAQLKAEYVLSNYGIECFADDTGLEISSLNNRPGVFSARYAGPEKDAQANMEKVLKELTGIEDRSARFKTTIAFATKKDIKLFTGICNGEMTHASRGDEGFGYDPIFQPEGGTKTFAEMTMAEKGKISHRARAIDMLISYLKEQIEN